MTDAWKRVAIYTMLRLLKTGDLDSCDAAFISRELADQGVQPDEIDSFFALYREHR